MNPRDPNLPLLESVARAFGPLRERFVFIGGSISGLLLMDAAASPARTTRDGDVIVEVVTLADYHRLEKELLEIGFRHDLSPDAPICRWTVGVNRAEPVVRGESRRRHRGRHHEQTIRDQMPRLAERRLALQRAELNLQLFDAFHGRQRPATRLASTEAGGIQVPSATQPVHVHGAGPCPCLTCRLRDPTSCPVHVKLGGYPALVST